MSEWKNAHKTFIERTIKISKKCFKKCEKNNCEISLLLNCCLGLLVVPKEKEINNIKFNAKNPLKNFFVIADKANAPSWATKTEIKDDKDLLIFLRNSIAHFGVTVFTENQETKITKIAFINNYKPSKTYQEAEISVKKFIEFFNQFSELLEGKILKNKNP